MYSSVVYKNKAFLVLPEKIEKQENSNNRLIDCKCYSGHSNSVGVFSTFFTEIK